MQYRLGEALDKTFNEYAANRFTLIEVGEVVLTVSSSGSPTKVSRSVVSVKTVNGSAPERRNYRLPVTRGTAGSVSRHYVNPRGGLRGQLLSEL
jgi:hypothetical protein